MKIEYTCDTFRLPNIHHQLYQLLVGIEQNHSQDLIKQYAKSIRDEFSSIKWSIIEHAD